MVTVSNGLRAICTATTTRHGRHLVLGAYLTWCTHDERAVVVEIDVESLIEKVLQIGSREARGIPEQQVEILGRPSGQPEAQFEAEPTLQDPPGVT